MPNHSLPRADACYRIQNLNFGTYLDIVYQSTRNGGKSTLVARPRKDGIKTQEWIIASRNATWTAMNNCSNPGWTDLYIDYTTARQGRAITPLASREAKNELGFRQEKGTDIVIIEMGSGILQTTDGFILDVKAPDEGEDEAIEDRAKWRLIEVCPLLRQAKDAGWDRGEKLKFCLLGLNGLSLRFDDDNAAVLSDSENIKTWWEIEPVQKGKCTIKVYQGDDNAYLIPTKEGDDEQPRFGLSKGPKFYWDLENIGGFAYQIIRPPTEADNQVALAVTIGNDNSVILKANKVWHGQIWLVERSYS